MISSSRERGWFLIAFALRHHRPRYPCDLVGECDGCDLRGSPRQQHCEPRPMPGAMGFGIADYCQRASREQATQIAITAFADIAEPILAFCLGTSPIQAEKSLPDRKALGSATLATKAVAKVGPTPGMSSSRRLASLDRCQALIIRSNCRICAFSIRNWAPRAATHVRATSDNRLSFESAATPSSCSTPRRPTGATIPNSAK